MPGLAANRPDAVPPHAVIGAGVDGDGGPQVAGAPATRPGADREVRPEIQALRALAVMLVVAFHLWPSVVPGGYVGVDVFFAISGFLITSHLLREISRRGRLSLTGFWARRARRLLPASCTVLLACAGLTLLLVPEIHWQSFFGDITASALYVQNWHLAASSVDYLASAEQPSPVQHFWSLSAEEQFYLVWPVLMLLAVMAAHRVGSRRRGGRRRAIALVLGTVTAASFVVSVLLTTSDPAQAYFVTPTRAWEFGAGGLLALVATGARVPAVVKSLVAWAGLAAIAVAAFAYSTGTAFPGYAAALPVAGTLAVMWAGAPRSWLSPVPLVSRRPIQFLGDISYSIYLWHWPLLILTPYALHHGLNDLTRGGILVASILVAWVTKVLVEDPVRTSRALTTRRPALSFALSAAGMGLVLAVAAGGTAHVENQLQRSVLASERTIAAHPRCFGAASHDRRHPCTNAALRTMVVPKPLEAKNEPNPACTRKTRVGAVSVCEFGVAPDHARRSFALIGDSHATHWRAGLEVVALRKGWHGLSITHTGCPYSRAVYVLPEPARSRCITWNQQVPGMLAKHPEVDTVFVSDITGGRVEVPRGRTLRQAQIDGYRRAWAAFPPTVKHVVVIRDTPKVHGTTLDCVDRAIAAGRPAGRACRVARSVALAPDPAATAARRLGPPRGQVIDTTHYICGKRMCEPVIGGVLVYKDVHHLTRVFATTLGPVLLRAVNVLERDWRAAA